jgi:Tfp pilus assembly protein PilN
MRAVNLIPSESRSGAAKAAGASGGSAYAVLAAVGGLAILALLYGLANHHISSRRGELASLSVRTQRAQAEASRLTPYTSFMALREQRTQDVAQLVDSRFDWAHAFAELGRVLPTDASVTALDGMIGATTKAGSSTAASSATSAAAPSAAAVASATPPGSIPSFGLTGCATSQAEVARTLARLRLIDGVSEVTLESSTKATSGGGPSTGGGGGACPGNDPAFSVQVTFEPLPAASASSPASVSTATASTGAGG